jgi:hypothetical protein
MSGTDDILNAMRRVVGDKPVYLVAGLSDLVNEKLREAQTDYKEFPLKAAGTLAGQFFRANLKVGEIYDDLTRRGEEAMARMRGEEVYAEEDEPFVREPYMPEPLHPPAEAARKDLAKVAEKAPAKTTKKAPAKKGTAASKKTVGATKKAGAKKAATKKAAAKKGAPRRRPGPES